MERKYGVVEFRHVHVCMCVHVLRVCTCDYTCVHAFVHVCKHVCTSGSFLVL